MDDLIELEPYPYEFGTKNQRTKPLPDKKPTRQKPHRKKAPQTFVSRALTVAILQT